ncbi:MAG: thioredoxin domain-containing protein [Myxococcales bacterium]|nr:thioredoxin domain-containing protein [Myxococcales bacterium]
MATTTAQPPHRLHMLGIWAALLVAVGAAGYLLRSFMLQTYGVDAFDSACNINETFNCDKINTSTYGKVFGLPVTIFALPYYSALAALAWLGSGNDDRARVSLRLLQIASGLAVAYGVFLIFIMISVEQTFCLFCLSMDAAALTVCVLSTLALKAIGEPEGHLSWPGPVATAVVVGLVSFGMTFTWHGDAKGKLVAKAMVVAEAKAKQADIDRKKFAEAQRKAAEHNKKKAGGQAAAGSAEATAATAATGPQVAKKITDALYVVPVHPDDAVMGPADAKVTVVEYADFQCGYCKKLFYAMQTVKQRYKGKVRFVFKHFPMSTRCNPHLKNNRHRYACNAALASECARRQGKFWQMHDMLFKNQHKLKSSDLRWYAEQVGLDMTTYGTCMRAPEPRQSLKRAIDEAANGLNIRATPRTFINGLLLSGSLPPEVLSRFIDEELTKAGQKAPEAAAAPAAAAPVAQAAAKNAGMVKVTTAKGSFFIDAYEAAIDKQGRAISLSGVKPANASWYEADAACKKAGKRMCTSYEWVSACQGKDAVDDDNNGNFADDYIEGNQFPYADYFEPGNCHVNGDRRTGAPVVTGANPRCRTPGGIFDLTGNVEEWIEQTEDKAQLAGGDYRVKEKGSCLRAHRSFGAGHMNRGIGFRCCADGDVANKSTEAAAKASPASLVGQKVKSFKAKRFGGGAVDESVLRGKVTFVSFFASWCSPCRREMPELATLVEKYGKRGFQILAVGVDTEAQLSEAFITQHARQTKGLIFATDANAKVLGRFDVTNMPTGYLVDAKGVVVHRQVGFGTKTVGELSTRIEALLK